MLTVFRLKDPFSHSAIINKVDSDGFVLSIIQKDGPYEIVISTPADSGYNVVEVDGMSCYTTRE